jgi:hypothetical protein
MPRKNAIPITVGVVGHLDVVTREEHKQQISQLFSDLAEKYPNSPLYLFSSVADGADRFVARIFLDLKYSGKDYNSRFELIIPGPFKKEEYRKDFNEESAREFDEFVSKAKSYLCVSGDEPHDDRPLQYLRAGKFVADSSIILLALWDGEKGKKGGTSDIVRHKIAGDDENVDESTFEYDGSVFIVPCRRLGSADSSVTSEKNSPPLSIDVVLKDAAIKETIEKIESINSLPDLSESDDFNHSRQGLFSEINKLNEPQRMIMNWYSLFDILSMKFRERDIYINILLFVFGFFFLIALEIYSNLSQTSITLGISMLFIVAATIIYWYSRITSNHRKYLINRTLAEALRIQFYWNLAGIDKNVSDFFLRIHRKDFTWLKHMLSAIYGITFINRKISTQTVSDLIENWIRDQSRFFKVSIIKMSKQISFYSRVANFFFIVSLALLFSIFFAESYYVRNQILNDLLVIIGSFLGIFALIKAYLEMKGYNQLMNQYELMKVIYDRAESKIEETDTYGLNEEEKNAYMKELFFVIGKEALIENGNWYQIFKEKEPELEGI